MPSVTQSAQPISQLTRGHKKRARTLAQILDAAELVFIRKGVDLTAITDIRDEAGISQGTFYNYFQSKEEVLEALGAKVSEFYKNKIFALCDPIEDPAERFAVFARLWLELAREAPEIAGIIVAAGDHLLAWYKQIDAHSMSYLESGVATGRFNVSADETTLVILRAMGSSGMRLVLHGKAEPEFDQVFVALFLRALGISSDEAEKIAALPMPEFPVGQDDGS